MASLFDFNEFIYNLDPQINFIKSLSPDILQSIKWYTQEGNAQTLNALLIKYNGTLKVENSEIDEKYILHLQNLEYIFKNIPSITIPLTVYRGVKDIFATDTYSTHTFVSTSVNNKIVNRFINYENKCCILRITVNPGAKIIPIISELSYHPDELEILLNKEFVMVLNMVSTQNDILYYDISYSGGILLDESITVSTITNIDVNESDDLYYEVVDKYKVKQYLIDKAKNQESLDENLLKLITKINNMKLKFSKEIINDVYNRIKLAFKIQIDQLPIQ